MTAVTNAEHVLQVLADTNGEWVDEDDILAIVGGSRDSLRRLVARLNEGSDLHAVQSTPNKVCE